MQNEQDLVPVFQTADAALLPLIKSVLEAAGIPYVVQGDQTMGIFPLGKFAVGVSKRALGAIVHVPADRAEEAKDLLSSCAEPETGED